MRMTQGEQLSRRILLDWGVPFVLATCAFVYVRFFEASGQDAGARGLVECVEGAMRSPGTGVALFLIVAWWAYRIASCEGWPTLVVAVGFFVGLTGLGLLSSYARWNHAAGYALIVLGIGLWHLGSKHSRRAKGA